MAFTEKDYEKMLADLKKGYQLNKHYPDIFKVNQYRNRKQNVPVKKED